MCGKSPFTTIFAPAGILNHAVREGVHRVGQLVLDPIVVGVGRIEAGPQFRAGPEARLDRVVACDAVLAVNVHRSFGRHRRQDESIAEAAHHVAVGARDRAAARRLGERLGLWIVGTPSVGPIGRAACAAVVLAQSAHPDRKAADQQHQDSGSRATYAVLFSFGSLPPGLLRVERGDNALRWPIASLRTLLESNTADIRERMVARWTIRLRFFLTIRHETERGRHGGFDLWMAFTPPGGVPGRHPASIPPAVLRGRENDLFCGRSCHRRLRSGRWCPRSPIAGTAGRLGQERRILVRRGRRFSYDPPDRNDRGRRRARTCFTCRKSEFNRMIVNAEYCRHFAILTAEHLDEAAAVIEQLMLADPHARVAARLLTLAYHQGGRREGSAARDAERTCFHVRARAPDDQQSDQTLRRVSASSRTATAD